MKDEKKTKDQLIKEFKKMREKVAGLEEVKLEYNQVDKKLKQTYKKLQKFIEGTAYIIMKVVETRDPYSIGHQQRVSKLATVIAREMKLPQDKIEGIRIASLVHDIGKVNLPTEIISKPGKLIEVEFNLIKNYPKVGYDILKKVDFPWPIAEIVLQHQEKIDGSGYPRGLKGDEICIEAKILGVANVVEAMSSYKSYRPALSIDEALAEISKNKNILFDPKVVDICLKLFKEKGFKF
ncbi:Cyclic di-GMP phosphodiesterase response regulator RpfG [subsurface metagenome]